MYICSQSYPHGRTSSIQRKKLAESDLVDFHEDVCGVIAKLSEGFGFAGRGVEEEWEVQSKDPRSSTDSDPVIVEHEAAPVEKETTSDIDKKTKVSENENLAPEKKRTLPEVDGDVG